MSNQVPTIVYKYNPRGFLLLGLYIVCLSIAVYYSFNMSVEQVVLFGSIFLAVPLYVRYGNSNRVRMLIPDDRELIFSSEGIDFGEDHYPVKGLETAAIYLESFTGFEYRRLAPGNGTSLQYSYVEAKGDNNKISFRFESEVVDFTFCLTSYAQFCMFRAVINDWLAAGVNVALKQAFDDEFIIGEMAYYKTPSRLQ